MMIQKYTVPVHELGLIEPNVYQRILLVVHNRVSTRLAGLTLYNAVPWIQDLVMGAPLPVSQPTLFVLPAYEFTETITADWVVHLYEGDTPQIPPPPIVEWSSVVDYPDVETVGVTPEIALPVEGEPVETTWPPAPFHLPGIWIQSVQLFGLTESQVLLQESDWRAIRELERAVLPEDNPVRMEREALRTLVEQEQAAATPTPD